MAWLVMLSRGLSFLTTRTRRPPLWIQYLGTAAIVTGVLGLRLWLTAYLSGYPILLFFGAIFACAVLFDRGAGAFAVLLSAAYIAFFLLPPTYSFALSNSEDGLGLALFIAIGLAIASVIEALHRAIRKATVLNSELVAANARLTAAEGEKDLLLREAGHRMKNDLTMLVALVQLQRGAAPDQATRAFLDTTVERIRVLSRVHDRLQRSETEAVVDTEAFIAELCGDLRASVMGIRPITLTLEIDQHELPQSRAVAVGLVINELLTNALKYAFPDDRSGRVTVVFRRDDARYHLSVIDNGVGLRVDEALPARGSGLGQRLVRAMAAQLGGTFIRSAGPGGGVRAEVVFPVEPM